jgi:thymidylate kinase
MVTVRKSKIIGIYGLLGAGKTTTLDQLKRELDAGKCKCFEGSDGLGNLCNGKLENLKKSPEEEKALEEEKAHLLLEGRCKDSAAA